MARETYSEETKAAVMAALLAGQSVTEVSTSYNIPRGTIANWSASFHRSDITNVSNTKKKEIGDLLLDYLGASLQSLKTQVEHFGDKSWLASQGASELAVLHGVQTDKAIRLLEALAASSEKSA